MTIENPAPWPNRTWAAVVERTCDAWQDEAFREAGAEVRERLVGMAEPVGKCVSAFIRAILKR